MRYCARCMATLDDGGSYCTKCGKPLDYTAPDYHLKPDTLLNGKFLIGAALGEGGFGITYVGRDMKLNLKVAVKEYFPSGYANRSHTVSSSVSVSSAGDKRDFYEKGKERFLREARTLARFAGEPGIVGIRDFFEANNTAYIVMEFVDGVDLKGYIAKNGVLDPKTAVRLLAPAMEALSKVHTQNLIHRDISPDNIMVSNGKVKLLDFGAARSVSAEANKSLSVVLKPGYAPEEQYRSKGNQGPWTDVYAMCATIYKCITGKTPDDATQRMFKDELKPPSALGVRIDTHTENVLMRGLSVRQENRYRSMEELLAAFSDAENNVNGGDTTVVIERELDRRKKDGELRWSADRSTSVKKKRNVAFWIFSAVTVLLATFGAMDITRLGLSVSYRVAVMALVLTFGVIPLAISGFVSIRRGSLKNATSVLVSMVAALSVLITSVLLIYSFPISRYRGEWVMDEDNSVTYEVDWKGNVNRYIDGKQESSFKIEYDEETLVAIIEEQTYKVNVSANKELMYLYDDNGEHLYTFTRSTNLPF